MTRGRRPAATFCNKFINLDERATRAGNYGVYTVESLKAGLCYFFEDEKVIIATSAGFMKMDLSTAELMANEILELSKDVRRNHRDGRRPIDTRRISELLEVRK